MTASHAVTSGRRWPSRATCGNWTRSVPPPPPITAPPRVSASSPATESAPGVAAHSQGAIAASTSSESRAQTDERLRETHTAWHVRRFLPDGGAFRGQGGFSGYPENDCSGELLPGSGLVG